MYDGAEGEDESRVLVDRLWPRGLSKAKADWDEWCKAVAPSTVLRQWYGLDPARFEEFTRRRVIVFEARSILYAGGCAILAVGVSPARLIGRRLMGSWFLALGVLAAT